MSGFEAAHTSAVLADRSNRELVAVTGPDRARFLQALLSSDVAALQAGAGQWSLLLQPQGKLVAVLRVLATDDTLFLDCDPSLGEVVASNLRRFLMRTQADIVELDWACLSVWGPAAEAAVHFCGPALDLAADLDHRTFDGALVVKAPLPTFDGYDIFVPSGAAADWWRRLEGGVAWAGGSTIGPEDADALRIEAGIPLMGVDLDERTIPQEAGVVPKAVSFTKGCYLGQELVARIDTRGHVNRELRIVELDAFAPAGATVVHGDRDVGVLTSTARSPHGALGLGLLRVQAAPGEAVAVRAAPDGEVRGVVRGLPAG
jgi:aminomethyltransferase